MCVCIYIGKIVIFAYHVFMCMCEHWNLICQLPGNQIHVATSFSTLHYFAILTYI